MKTETPPDEGEEEICLDASGSVYSQLVKELHRSSQDGATGADNATWKAGGLLWIHFSCPHLEAVE